MPALARVILQEDGVGVAGEKLAAATLSEPTVGARRGLEQPLNVMRYGHVAMLGRAGHAGNLSCYRGRATDHFTREAAAMVEPLHCTVSDVTGQIVRGNAEASSVSVELKGADGRALRLSLPMLDALFLLNNLREIETEGGFRQRNRQDRDRVLVGRIPRMGLSAMTSEGDVWSRRVQIEIEDQTDASSWKIEMPLQDMVFLHGEFASIRKKLGI